MASQLDVVRGLKIKTNTLKRLQKELGYYEKEREREAARVEKMKAEGADEHDVRQAENVAAESAMMVPETRQRLEAALTDLIAFLHENEQDAGGSEELASAKEALSLAQQGGGVAVAAN